MKNRLLISFSGGRTSAYMMWWIMNEWSHRHDFEIVVVFANTGKESEGTLEFVNRCSAEWGIPIVWVEARHLDDSGNRYSEKGWGVGHRVVDFETASRKGEPFEEMTSVLGIPTTNAPFCSDQLKRKAIESYLKSINWKPSSFYKAIGIRSDEVDRVNENFRKLKIIYVLVSDNPKTELEIQIWWHQQNFDLEIDKDFGNCDNCWKKDLLRLCRNARKDESSFDWWQKTTDTYGQEVMRPSQEGMTPPFNFYRGNLSPKDIIEISKFPDNEISAKAKTWKLDGCSESCEAY